VKHAFNSLTQLPSPRAASPCLSLGRSLTQLPCRSSPCLLLIVHPRAPPSRISQSLALTPVLSPSLTRPDCGRTSLSVFSASSARMSLFLSHSRALSVSLSELGWNSAALPRSELTLLVTAQLSSPVPSNSGSLLTGGDILGFFSSPNNPWLPPRNIAGHQANECHPQCCRRRLHRKLQVRFPNFFWKLNLNFFSVDCIILHRFGHNLDGLCTSIMASL